MRDARRPTAAQIALAWLLAQKSWIVPIPGTRKLERLDENLGALEVQFTADELVEIDRATSKIQVHGARGTGTEQYAVRRSNMRARSSIRKCRLKRGGFGEWIGVHC
jgi:diketogulonate reductase-like aldo/keto reductase